MKKYLVGGLVFIMLVSWSIGITLFATPKGQYLKENMVKVQIYDEWGYAGMGSGFLYDDGRIMTAAHVVEDANSFNIIYFDGTEETAYVYQESRYDIGIIYVERECDDPVSWNINSLDIGATVFTQGYPYDVGVLRLSKGIVSSVEWTTYIWPAVILVDAESDPGNSGGPLLDKNGRVCGIVVGKIGSVVLCVPGRLLFDFANNPCGEDHAKKATDNTEAVEEARQMFQGVE